MATTAGSILSMWALEPGLFQLLGRHSRLECGELAQVAPALHHSSVQLFLQHCNTHSQFLPSSVLLSPGSTSPTANHFSQALEIVTKLQVCVGSNQLRTEE